MTDVDGSIKYSKVVVIINDDKGFVISSISPNPVQDAATISLTAAKKGAVQFTIYNVSGNIVKQWYSNITEGVNTINMNVQELTSGIYWVLAYSLDTKATFRFIRK